MPSISKKSARKNLNFNLDDPLQAECFELIGKFGKNQARELSLITHKLLSSFGITNLNDISKEQVHMVIMLFAATNVSSMPSPISEQIKNTICASDSLPVSDDVSNIADHSIGDSGAIMNEVHEDISSDDDAALALAGFGIEI